MFSMGLSLTEVLDPEDLRMVGSEHCWTLCAISFMVRNLASYTGKPGQIQSPVYGVHPNHSAICLYIYQEFDILNHLAT